MKKYQDMDPCERIRYYEGRIRSMTPPRSERECLLIDTFRYLIAENETLCIPANGEYPDQDHKPLSKAS